MLWRSKWIGNCQWRRLVTYHSKDLALQTQVFIQKLFLACSTNSALRIKRAIIISICNLNFFIWLLQQFQRDCSSPLEDACAVYQSGLRWKHLAVVWRSPKHFKSTFDVSPLFLSGQSCISTSVKNRLWDNIRNDACRRVFEAERQSQLGQSAPLMACYSPPLVSMMLDGFQSG